MLESGRWGWWSVAGMDPRRWPQHGGRGAGVGEGLTYKNIQGEVLCWTTALLN